eukprot:scaffold16214_cov29-Attheya_sp.AAC.1
MDEKCQSGRLFSRKLNPPRLYGFEEDFFRVLSKVQATTDFIGNDVEVTDDYGISRSSRRGVSTHTRNMGVSDELLHVFNRWRREMQGSGGLANLDMADMYSKLDTLIRDWSEPPFLRNGHPDPFLRNAVSERGLPVSLYNTHISGAEFFTSFLLCCTIRHRSGTSSTPGKPFVHRNTAGVAGDIMQEKSATKEQREDMNTRDLPWCKHFRRVCEAKKENSGHWWQYESSVGSALPIITTLRDLQETGDKIHSIEGCLRRSIAFILSTLSETVPFYKAVREAVQQDYTENDVRDDLSGLEFARKVVILTRQIGLEVNREDEEVESILPDKIINKVYDGDTYAVHSAILLGTRGPEMFECTHARTPQGCGRTG